ncbi:glycosyl hydrolase family 8 [Nocardioides sp. GY 10127]|uniref:glycosyl hydrolase family 8 n=1 Tax=Nocardioides sp. GY 10127 TaxID=2569762 RepID=UPI0010A7B856|nr:glycosyl hydrolase family 8 [Nocardioides sp. GY 10127]TIC82602.1 glycoside hydrolase [Nocardioides sp. GY 10127]
MSRAARQAVTAVAVVVLVVAALVLVRAVRSGDDVTSTPADPTTTAADGTSAAQYFLDTYVDADGRVVRRDQGDDTVSEGQAYAMLVAVGSDDEDTFDAVWSWTQAHLLRSQDGLLSWHWSGGEVVDASSASDADLDAARALVLAGQKWGDDSLTRAGVDLGTAILDHETVSTPAGLVLVAGQWATSSSPYWFNPSYVSPAAMQVLYAASGDSRWTSLEAGSNAAVRAATVDGQLTPDWATIDDQGNASPSASPSGAAAVFSYDAARTLVRNAESCSSDDTAITAALAAILGTSGEAYGTYSLDAQPQTSDLSALTAVAQAAGAAVTGDDATAEAKLAEARSIVAQGSTYYGAAWAALGSIMLTTDALGGCPPLADDASSSATTSPTPTPTESATASVSSADA